MILVLIAIIIGRIFFTYLGTIQHLRRYGRGGLMIVFGFVDSKWTALHGSNILSCINVIVGYDLKCGVVFAIVC